jgi:hypothetical protein
MLQSGRNAVDAIVAMCSLRRRGAVQLRICGSGIMIISEPGKTSPLVLDSLAGTHQGRSRRALSIPGKQGRWHPSQNRARSSRGMA